MLMSSNLAGATGAFFVCRHRAYVPDLTRSGAARPLFFSCRRSTAASPKKPAKVMRRHSPSAPRESGLRQIEMLAARPHECRACALEFYAHPDML